MSFSGRRIGTLRGDLGESSLVPPAVASCHLGHMKLSRHGKWKQSGFDFVDFVGWWLVGGSTKGLMVSE